MTQIVLRVKESFEQITDAEKNAWEELVLRTTENIYSTYTWTSIWWEQYKRRGLLRIVFFYRDDKLVAVLPFAIDKLKLLLFSIKVARLISSYNPYRIMDPPIESQSGEEIMHLLVKHFIVDEKCDYVGVGPYTDNYIARQDLKKHVPVLGKVLINEKRVDICTYFILPLTYDEYLESLSSRKGKVNRKLDFTPLQKDHEVSFKTFKKPEEIATEFPEFVRMHATQWNQEGKLGHFGAWPGSFEFHSKLSREFAKKGNTRLYAVYAGSEVIVYQYAYLMGKKCFWLLPARAVEEKWNKYSVGQKGVVQLINFLLEEGIGYIEAGIGRYGYKTKLGAIESNVFSLEIMSGTKWSKIKRKFFSLVVHLLDILYNKIWYVRIQPRLPAFLRRPIWQFWIDLTT